MKMSFAFLFAVLAATVILLLANERLNRYLIFSSSNSNPYKMYRLFVDAPGDEIPILGSSRAEAGFAPKELSEKSFNYGLSGSSMRETAFHLKAVTARPSNGLVIVNLDPWGLGNGDFLGRYRFAADVELVKEEPKVKLSLIDRIPGGVIAEC